MSDNPAGIQIPDELPNDGEDAYLLGVEHAVRRFGVTAETLARELEERREQKADDEDDEECPDCGGEVVEDFGGEKCIECGKQIET